MMRATIFILKVGFGVVAIVVYLTVGWALGLIVVFVWVVGLLLAARRTERAYEDFIRCPRGHVVAQYGVGRCGACGATSEGSLWECLHCGALHGFVNCQVCGLSVANPMFGRGL